MKLFIICFTLSIILVVIIGLLYPNGIEDLDIIGVILLIISIMPITFSMGYDFGESKRKNE